MRKIRKGTGAEISQGGNRQRWSARGGRAPSWRKKSIYLTLPLNVLTYCCGESMGTNCIKTMGCTWKREPQTTLSGSVVGAG